MRRWISSSGHAARRSYCTTIVCRRSRCAASLGRPRNQISKRRGNNVRQAEHEISKRGQADRTGAFRLKGDSPSRLQGCGNGVGIAHQKNMRRLRIKKIQIVEHHPVAWCLVHDDALARRGQIRTVRRIRKGTADGSAIDPAQELGSCRFDQRCSGRVTMVHPAKRLKSQHEPRLWWSCNFRMLLEQMRQQRRSGPWKAEQKADRGPAVCILAQNTAPDALEESAPRTTHLFARGRRRPRNFPSADRSRHFAIRGGRRLQFMV
ncbi:hypothetical protein ABIF05_007020 [Bradyrhizobium elkanii]